MSDALEQIASGQPAGLTVMAGLSDGHVITFTGARTTGTEGRYRLQGVTFLSGPATSIVGANRPTAIEVNVDDIVWGGRSL